MAPSDQPSKLERWIGRWHRRWTALVEVVPLVGWVSYPPLILTLGAVLAVVAGGGTALGIPSLVWHDAGGTQFLAGLAAAALCWHLGLIDYLLDSRDLPERQA